MARIERSIAISRSPEDVFDVLTDLHRLNDWATTVAETRNVPDGPLRAGDTFEQTVGVAGVNIETDWKVVEIERPRRVVYDCKGRPGGSLQMTQRVLPADGGSRVELEIDYELPGGLLGETVDKLYVERRNEREAESSLQNLKELLEGERA